MATKVWSVAQLKLVDFLRNKQSSVNDDQNVRISSQEAVEAFTKKVEHDATMKVRSKGYRMLCVKK